MVGFRLYDYDLSGNGWKVRTVLRCLGHMFDIHWVDLLRGEQHEGWFLAKNPVGQIPVLEDESGHVWTESNAILETFAEGSRLLPNGHDRHLVRAWLCFEQAWIDGVISRARFRRLFPAVIDTPRGFLEAWAAEGNRALNKLENHLSSRAFMVGERFTIADIALYAYVHLAEEGGFELARFPAVMEWLERVAGEAGVQPLLFNPEATPQVNRAERKGA